MKCASKFNQLQSERCPWLRSQTTGTRMQILQKNVHQFTANLTHCFSTSRVTQWFAYLQENCPKKENKKVVITEKIRNHIRLPAVSKNANVIKNRWNINNTGAWSSICKQESLTSTGWLFPLIIPRLPLVIISTQSRSSSKWPVKINSRLQKVFPTATQLLHECRRSSQDDTFFFKCGQYLSNSTVTALISGTEKACTL